jgi:hypothetical protein
VTAGSAGSSASGVQFLVVGSPRSGTTLVQRLACEIPGVRMPPETHFFSQFAVGLMTRRRFPLDAAVLAEEIDRFASANHAGGLAIETGAVVDDLGGICARPYDLFEALVRHLAGPAEVFGEKTPNHLIWWRPIARAAPHISFVVVVRDPRAVVASNLDMPWRDDSTLPAWGDGMHRAFAVLWRFLQAQVPLMVETLTPRRCLVLRYEDVVADPEATRARLAVFLGRPRAGAPQAAPPGIVLPWETWKSDALAAISDSRVSSWGQALDRRQVDEISVVCRAGMQRFDYTEGLPSPAAVASTWARLGPAAGLRIARYSRSRRANLRTIEGFTL